MSSTVDFQRLARLVREKRGGRGLRETSDEIGDVSPSTLSRIEGERVSDMAMSTFLRVCDWLGVNPADLLIVPETAKPAELSEGDAIELQLRASKDLSAETADMLADFISHVYKKAQQTQKSNG